VRPLSIVIACITVTACSRQPSPPSPPSTTPSTETITGTERIGWSQQAANATELATFRYAIYVDGARSEISGATCSSTPSGGSFQCTGPLPSLTRGAHTLEIATFLVDGTVFESTRSAPLQVNVAAAAASIGDESQSRSRSDPEEPRERDRTRGAPFAVERIIDGLRQPTTIAISPDGRILVGEEEGSIQVVDNQTESDAAPLKPSATMHSADANIPHTLLGLALDPDFARTHLVYALYTTQVPDRGPTFVLARFREAGGTFGAPAILLDDVPASVQPRGSLRFGPDAKLYVAFDDGGDPDRVGDAASFNGKVLRLNADGTTPPDQAGASPVYSPALRAPNGLDWDASSGVLWIAGASSTGVGEIVAVVDRNDRGRYAISAHPLDITSAGRISSIAFYPDSGNVASARNTLLVTSPERQQLLQLTLDDRDRTRIAAMRPVLTGRGPLRAVAVDAGGLVYVATNDAILRLTPASAPAKP
jgi:glucose/arabinose dehydrogenase